MPGYDLPVDAYCVSACGNRMSSRRDPVSGRADKVPPSADQMSRRTDNMLCHRYSCMPDYDLLVDAYYVYSSKDGLSVGRDSVPGRRYKVSACFDQMSA